MRQELARRFRAREAIGERMNRQSTAALSSAVLQDTFDVFESYL